MVKNYRYFVENGICPTCKSKPKSDNVVLCERCHSLRLSPERKEKQRQLVRAYKIKQEALGLCERCKNKRVEGRTECQICIDKCIAKREQRKTDVFNLYGNKCNCCGESTREFLTIDHVNGGGAKERKAGFKVFHLRSKLLKEGKANPNYQILCMNCNLSRGLYGYCPHEKK